MTIKTRILTIAAAASAFTLAACNTMGGGYQANQYNQQYVQPQYTQQQYAQQQYNNAAGYGQVTNVQQLQGGSSTNGIAGALIGAAVGGLAGNQVGKGSGRKWATVAGAVGGAVAGNMIEGNISGNHNAQTFYRVTVQLDNGAVRQFDYQQPPNINIGSRVRVDGNQLYR